MRFVPPPTSIWPDRGFRNVLSCSVVRSVFTLADTLSADLFLDPRDIALSDMLARFRKHPDATLGFVNCSERLEVGARPMQAKNLVVQFFVRRGSAQRLERSDGWNHQRIEVRNCILIHGSVSPL